MCIIFLIYFLFNYLVNVTVQINLVVVVVQNVFYCYNDTLLYVVLHIICFHHRTSVSQLLV